MMKYMNNLVLLALISLMTVNAFGQDTKKKPFFQANKFESDAFVEISGQLTEFTGDPSAITRFGLTWTINHTWSLNATYDILTTQNNVADLITLQPEPGESVIVDYQSFGLKFGYVFFHDKPVSLHPEWKFAWGQTRYEYPQGRIRNWNFYVGEPMVNAVFNLTDYFRLGVNVSWRYAFGVDLDGITDGDVNGFAGSVFFRLGQF